jgi:MoxR-like ATPase
MEGAAAVMGQAELTELQEASEQVTVEDSLAGYMLAIVAQTRKHESLSLGVSPRGAQALYRCVQALALMEGRDYAIPDDIKRLTGPVFAHRVVMNQRVSMSQRSTEQAERILEEILDRTEVPL